MEDIPLHFLIGIGAILIISCLVVRDRTEDRMQKLKTEFLALRTDEKRQADMREDIELTVAQATEALMRADRRNNSMRKGCEAVSGLLDQLEEFEEKGVPVRPSKDTEEVEELDEEQLTEEDMAAEDQVPEV